MSEPTQKDGGDVTRVDRPGAKKEADVDRTASTVMVPGSKRGSDLGANAPSSSGSPALDGKDEAQDTGSTGHSPASLRALQSFRSGSHSSGGGPTRPPGSLRSRAFPVVGWEKYEHIEFIGEGGMGRVYKVRDRVLQRFLALKFIRDEDERLIRRFLQEAQAQARIEHEHVCKVYEVGEVDGLPYIAMQYIEGKSLKEAIHTLSVEQKVTVIRQVALALSAAHRMGIIHRDIKPSNIMIEQKEGGAYHAYIMDFGLAREMASPGESVAGLIEGTPSYMAPEQARGDHKKLDRRADIYSLGATLYQQLAERPPFTGDSSLTVLMAVENDEAVPLRKLVPAVSEDLDVIAMKCIEKDPSRRYDSAKALADDLERYLSGEPIAARKASWSYLALKKIRKHKALFAVSCAGAIGVFLAAGFGIRARMAAAEQAELSKQLGEDVKEMEYLLRWAYGLPLHNVSREKARIRDRMKEIEGRIGRMGKIGEGPGHYALGRGYLALREPEQAREHLERALSAGYGGVEVERALGTALGEIFSKELEETRRIGDKKEREARRGVIEKELLEPALGHLERGGGEGLESSALMEGLMAFYQKRYDLALEKAKESEEKALSTYEATKLKADIYSALGTGKKEKGEAEGALLEYDRAAAAYGVARGIARSDAAVYEAECEMWVQRMEVELNGGKSLKGSFEKAVGACDGALVANPESGAGYGRKAWALWMYGRYLERSNQDPREVLTQAIEVGEAAVRLEPKNANHWDTIGNAYSAIGRYEMNHAKDPRDSLRKAAENLERAIELHPNFAWAYNDLGGVYRRIGEYELSHGIDPAASFAKSVVYRQKAVQIDPGYYYPYTNMGISHGMQAQYDLRQGKDPSEAIRLSIEDCQRSLEINKSYFVTYDVLGLIYLINAQYNMYRGEPYEDSIQKALQSFDAEISMNSSAYYPRMGITMIHLLVASEALRSRKDALMQLDKAEAALREAEKTGGTDPMVVLQRAKLMLLKARQALDVSKKPQDIDMAFQDAEAAWLSLQKMGAGLWEVAETGAGLSFWHALMMWEHKNDKKMALELSRMGIERAEEGLAISPDEPSLLAWKGTLMLLSAHIEGDIHGSDKAQSGRAILDKALQRNHFLRHEWDTISAQIQKKR